jgi:hypothetical protein
MFAAIMGVGVHLASLCLSFAEEMQCVSTFRVAFSKGFAVI